MGTGRFLIVVIYMKRRVCDALGPWSDILSQIGSCSFRINAHSTVIGDNEKVVGSSMVPMT